MFPLIRVKTDYFWLRDIPGHPNILAQRQLEKYRLDGRNLTPYRPTKQNMRFLAHSVWALGSWGEGRKYSGTSYIRRKKQHHIDNAVNVNNIVISQTTENRWLKRWRVGEFELDDVVFGPLEEFRGRSIFVFLLRLAPLLLLSRQRLLRFCLL